MLLGGQRCGLAGGAAGHQGIRPLLYLPVDQFSERRFIDSARRKRGHQRWYRPEKHELFPSLELAGAISVREIRARCSAADKDSGDIMSSMRSVGIIIPLLLSTMAVASMQQTSSTPASTAASVQATSQAAVTEINYALADWRRLRASQGYAFADYARFLNANPGWPSESTMRRSAERQMRPGENANVVLAFFRTDEPRTGTGWARLAEANLSIGRSAEALAAARGAWMSSDLSQYDEQLIFSRFGTQLSAADHDKRVDALLLDKKASDAYRMLPWSSPARRAALQARIAMQARQPEAEQRYQAVIGQVTSDAGLMMDRARYLRDSGYVQASRDLFARSHNFGAKPPIPSGSST